MGDKKNDYDRIAALIYDAKEALGALQCLTGSNHLIQDIRAKGLDVVWKALNATQGWVEGLAETHRAAGPQPGAGAGT